MNARLLDLRERRGVLRARCAQQRKVLAEHAAALAPVCTVIGWARDGGQWVRRHPGLVGATVAGLVVLKPRRIWRIARWTRKIYTLRHQTLRLFSIWPSWGAKH